MMYHYQHDVILLLKRVGKAVQPNPRFLQTSRQTIEAYVHLHPPTSYSFLTICKDVWQSGQRQAYLFSVNVSKALPKR